MKRLMLCTSLALLLAASTRFAGAQPFGELSVGPSNVEGQQPAPGNTPRFTGKSEVMDGKDLSAARRSFEAGARTAWHSHDNGQLLMVEKGRMRTQKKGQAVQEMGIGGTDYTGPNVVHWHGAAANEPLVQINVGFGGGSKWFEDVTDEEYRGRR